MDKLHLKSRKEILEAYKNALKPNPKLRHQDPYIVVTKEMLEKLLHDFELLQVALKDRDCKVVFKRLRLDRLEESKTPKFLRDSIAAKMADEVSEQANPPTETAGKERKSKRKRNRLSRN